MTVSYRSCGIFVDDVFQRYYRHHASIHPLPIRGSPRDNLPSVLRIFKVETDHLLMPQENNDMKSSLSPKGDPYIPERGDGKMSARAFIIMFYGFILRPFTARSILGRAVLLAKAIIEDRPFLQDIQD